LRTKIFSPQNLINAVQNKGQRGLWWWTVMMFNKIDMERTKALGYDRTTAEWLLKNGACARFVGSPLLFCDYNTLPPENTKFQVKEFEADDAGINSEGFAHLKGCEKLDRIVLKNCSYVTDEALYKLEMRKDSLRILEISKCKNITEDGLRALQKLTKLEKLVAHELPYVKNIEQVQQELKQHLANCQIDIK